MADDQQTPLWTPPGPDDPKPVDVTDEKRAKGVLINEDGNAEDTLWAWQGRMVKIKTFYDPDATLGLQIFRISGSVVGEDGKALLLANGQPAIYGPPLILTFHAYGDTKVEDAVTAARHRVVIETLRAHETAQTTPTLKGLAPLPDASLKTGPNPRV